MSFILQETVALTIRSIRRLSRERVSMIFGLVQPMIFWLILFGSLFQRTARIPGFEGLDYITFLAGGVVAMTVLNSGLSGGVDLLFDKESGFLQRLLSAPISRNSLIYSRFVFVMGVTLAQILVILLVAYIMFGVFPKSGLEGMAFIMFVSLLFGLGLIAISMTLAFAIKGHGNFFALMGFLTLPLIFLSTALVPLSAMPGWMAIVAQLNPMTYAADAIRAIIYGGWLWADITRMMVVLFIFDVVSIWLSSRVFHRQLA